MKSAAQWFDRIALLVEEYELLAWIALAIGVVALFVTGQANLTLLLALSILVTGVVLGGIVLSFFRRRSQRIRCLGCVDTYRISGAHGEKTAAEERMLLRAMKRVESFTYTIVYWDGDVLVNRFEYRNLGRKNRNEGVPFIELGDTNIVQGRTQTSRGGRAIRIIPPAPIRKKEHVEIRWTEQVTNGFPEEVEGVGKRVLFPIKRLKFDVQFRDGTVDNVHGTVFVGDVEEEFHPLDVEKLEDDSLSVVWEVKDATPGERYVLSWRWN